MIGPFESQLMKEFSVMYCRDYKPHSTCIFNSVNKPGISIDAYYKRIIEYTKCDKSVIDAVWVYLKRLVYDNCFVLHGFNIHRILSQAFNLALKFIDDDHISDIGFCKIIGYKIDEFILLEKHFLELLEYNCMTGVINRYIQNKNLEWWYN